MYKYKAYNKVTGMFFDGKDFNTTISNSPELNFTELIQIRESWLNVESILDHSTPNANGLVYVEYVDPNPQYLKYTNYVKHFYVIAMEDDWEVYEVNDDGGNSFTVTGACFHKTTKGKTNYNKMKPSSKDTVVIYRAEFLKWVDEVSGPTISKGEDTYNKNLANTSYNEDSVEGYFNESTEGSTDDAGESDYSSDPTEIDSYWVITKTTKKGIKYHTKEGTWSKRYFQARVFETNKDAHNLYETRFVDKPKVSVKNVCVTITTH